MSDETLTIQSLPIATGDPQRCPMPGCHGETEMASYSNQNVFFVRCKTHPLWHFGPHRETEAEALAAWNEPLERAGNDARILKLLLSDTELLLELERKDTAYLRGKLQALAELGRSRPVAFLSTDIPVLHGIVMDLVSMQPHSSPVPATQERMRDAEE